MPAAKKPSKSSPLSRRASAKNKQIEPVDEEVTTRKIRVDRPVAASSVLTKSALTMWSLLAGFSTLEMLDVKDPEFAVALRYKVDEAQVIASGTIERMMSFYIQSPSLSPMDREVWTAIEAAVHMLRDWYGVNVRIPPLPLQGPWP